MSLLHILPCGDTKTSVAPPFVSFTSQLKIKCDFKFHVCACRALDLKVHLRSQTEVTKLRTFQLSAVKVLLLSLKPKGRRLCLVLICVFQELYALRTSIVFCQV